MPCGRKYPRRHCEEKGYTENTEKAVENTEKKNAMELCEIKKSV
jgi:hypothetical protein